MPSWRIDYAIPIRPTNIELVIVCDVFLLFYASSNFLKICLF